MKRVTTRILTEDISLEVFFDPIEKKFLLEFLLDTVVDYQKIPVYLTLEEMEVLREKLDRTFKSLMSLAQKGYYD